MLTIPADLPQIIRDRYLVKENSFVYAGIPLDRDYLEVEVGDRKRPETFLPQIKITRWDNEVNFSLRLLDPDRELSELVVSGEVIKLKGRSREAHFYPILPGPEHREGAWEFAVVLHSRPAGDRLAFSVVKKGVRLHFQRPLSREEQEKLHVRQPERARGSFAVYRESWRPTFDKGKRYGMNKVGHLFRPRVTDAAGRSAWGTWRYLPSVSLLVCFLDPKFLDSAVYPVTVDPTFGYDQSGSMGINYVYKRPGFSFWNRGGQGYVIGDPGTLDKIWASMEATEVFDVKGFVNQDTNDDGQLYQVAVKELTDVDASAGWKEFVMNGEGLSATIRTHLNIFPDPNSISTPGDIWVWCDFLEDWSGHFQPWENNPTDYSSPNDPWIPDSIQTIDDFPAWAIDTEYFAYDSYVQHGGKVFECSQDHTSSAETEPEVGEFWFDYWNVYYTITYSIYAEYTSTAPPPYERPPSVRLHGPLFSLTARGWLGGYSYKMRGVVSVPYPIGLLPRIREPYFMPAFPLRPYPSFIAQYYSASGWIYQRRRTWHGMTWIAMAGYTVPNPRTATQQANRYKFGSAVAAWQGLNTAEKEIWKGYDYPRRASGYNRFLRAYMLDKLPV